MKLTINGEVKTFNKTSIMVGELLDYLEIKAKYVAVEVNSKIVMQDAFDDTLLQENDQIEVVSFVGGG